MLKTKHHFNVLDSFRGLSACFVAFSHFHANSIIYRNPIFDVGAVWVDFFFVLSGFVISANYMKKLKNGYSLSQFMFLRFARLYPLHIFLLISFLLFDALQLFIQIDGAALSKPFSGPGESPWAIFAHATLIHSLGTTDILTYNGPSWSISVEFYAYLLFALVFSFAKKWLYPVIMLFVLISVAILIFYSNGLYAKLDYGFFRCVYGFGLGVIIWIIYKKYEQKLMPYTQKKEIFNMLEVSVLSFTLFFIFYHSLGSTSYFIPLIFSVVIFIFSFEAGIISKFLNNKIFILLGTLSYSIYMTHIFISGKFFALPIRLLEGKLGWDITTENNDIFLYGTNIYIGTIIELFYLLVVIGCSYITYKIIEEPCRNKAKELLKTRKNKI